MKYARLQVTPDPTLTPRLFDVLARSDVVSEARLHDWNLAPPGGDVDDERPPGQRGVGVATMLFEADGDRDRFERDLADARGVRSAETTTVGGGRFAALLVVEPGTVPLMAAVFGSFTRDGLVVATPVVYREGRVHARIVGTAAVLQRAFDAFPSGVAVDVEAVGEYQRRRERPTSLLSDRQREAVLAALDLGYYDQPRQATHADVAERLDCAPNTASEHLQKAEAKLLRATLRLEGD